MHQQRNIRDQNRNNCARRWNNAITIGDGAINFEFLQG